jgi:thiosulfate/3-mercaptopyruvate sulfurtransferase
MPFTLPSLVDAETLSDALPRPEVLVLDTTVELVRPPDGGPYEVRSGRQAYTAAHIPGAVFADIPGELSDPQSPFPFTLPSPEHFAQAAGRLGIGDGVHAVTYAQDSPMWATRLWWQLCFFGFDAVSVLDGGLRAWQAAGLPLEDGPVSSRPGDLRRGTEKRARRRARGGGTDRRHQRRLSLSGQHADAARLPRRGAELLRTTRTDPRQR